MPGTVALRPSTREGKACKCLESYCTSWVPEPAGLKTQCQKHLCTVKVIFVDEQTRKYRLDEVPSKPFQTLMLPKYYSIFCGQWSWL